MSTFRSLGVHISFVRSIAMDSWSDKQLAIMKIGGNDKCNAYLKERGIDARTPIKQKYESDAAQLYKQVVRARAEGKPEPTVLAKPAPKSGSYTGSYSAPSSGQLSVGSAASAGGSNDPNGMERLAGETDQQYIARQTRLREEARARMQAKFGSSGGKMGGVGSGGMQGIGSSAPDNGGIDLDGVISGFGSAFGAMGSIVGSAATQVSSGVSTLVQDESTRGAISGLGSTVTSVGGSFWNSISNVATNITAPDGGDDGLAQLQREIAANRPSQSKYGGIGSETAANTFASTKSTFAQSPARNAPVASPMGGSAPAGEAPGMPGEDRNGVERLTGESDEQYIARQTRLRDEAKARMAAKFGGGGIGGGVSSSSPSPYKASSPAPAASFNPAPAPSSGNWSSTGAKTPPRKNSKDMVNNDDFFSSFGA